jgi:hypothetical protein
MLSVPSVIVRDLDVVSVTFVPDKADSPLLVVPHAMLTNSVSPQGFQLIAQRHSQIIQACGSIEHQQLLATRPPNVMPKPFRRHILEDGFGALIGERSDH